MHVYVVTFTKNTRASGLVCRHTILKPILRELLVRSSWSSKRLVRTLKNSIPCVSLIIIKPLGSLGIQGEQSILLNKQSAHTPHVFEYSVAEGAVKVCHSARASSAYPPTYHPLYHPCMAAITQSQTMCYTVAVWDCHQNRNKSIASSNSIICPTNTRSMRCASTSEKWWVSCINEQTKNCMKPAEES